MKYQSNALWPDGIYDYDCGITQDIHDSEGSAESVCGLLRREGFGGEGKSFPLLTWVSECSNKDLPRLQASRLIRSQKEEIKRLQADIQKHKDAWNKVNIGGDR